MLLDKSSGIREESRFMVREAEEEGGHHGGGGGKLKIHQEESILEYGPGIVRKLRSRYQSLALRQLYSRPSLRRSASLEDGLDKAGSGEGTTPPLNTVGKRESPSPTPYTEGGGRMVKSTSLSTDGGRFEKGPVPRGRTGLSEQRKDRMRRARSVDALHTRSRQEEEILEKFKSVVEPKEEIVIIEVSRTRNLQSGGGLDCYSAAGFMADKPQIPTNLAISSSNNGRGDYIRSRSFASPEHELPPHDIVRETARIFEKNQENLANSPGGKKIGQALRLSKSLSVGESPTPPPLQVSLEGASQQVMAQRTVPPIQPLPDSDGKNTTNSLTKAGPNHAKQIGIIRPTVSHSISSSKAVEKVVPPSGSVPATRSSLVRSPVLSPILGPSQSYKSFLQQHNQKPPLSPKPILFTSSPKPPNEMGTKARFGSSPTSNYQSEVIKGSPFDKSSSIGKSPSPLPTIGGGFEGQEVRAPIEQKVILAKAVITNRESLKTTEDLSGFAPPSNKEPLSPASLKRSQFSGPLKQQSSSFLGKLPGSVEPDRVNGLKSGSDNEPGKTTPLVPRKEQPPPVPKARIQMAPESKPPLPPVAASDAGNASQLRTHQKQKSNQSGNSTMVFNFTGRSKVPDYIEDDGLDQSGRINLVGTVTDESVDDVDSRPGSVVNGTSRALTKPINFEGANVIINGRSNIQKKPKSKKMSISFNESATTTYEYPSESSLLAEQDDIEKDILGHKGPSLINNSGTGLGSYTPKQANNDYQLGNFVDMNCKKDDKSLKKEDKELIEDYLKPDTENTTWSNEIGADILF